jgi:hypothetical protein
MYFNYVLATSLAVITARAFLLPPELTAADVKLADAISPLLDGTGTHRMLQLDCPDCITALKGYHGFVRVEGFIPSHLQLNFTVDRREDGQDRLLLNDFELYPNFDPLAGALTAPHIPHFHTIPLPTKYQTPQPLEPRLGFALRTNKTPKDAEGNESIELDLQVVEVGGQFVSGVPSVLIVVIGSQNHLYIYDVVEAASETADPATPKKPTECKTILCKWQALVSKIAHIKPFKHCGSGKVHPASKDKHGHHGQHDHHHGKHAGHHHGGPAKMVAHHHTWVQLAKNVASHILLPALIGIFIGIVVGVIASLIGMMVSKLVVYLWRSFFRTHTTGRRHCHRRHGSGHASHRAVQKEDAASEEKTSLITDQEPPPSYEADEEPIFKV